MTDDFVRDQEIKRIARVAFFCIQRIQNSNFSSIFCNLRFSYNSVENNERMLWRKLKVHRLVSHGMFKGVEFHLGSHY